MSILSQNYTNETIWYKPSGWETICVHLCATTTMQLLCSWWCLVLIPPWLSQNKGRCRKIVKETEYRPFHYALLKIDAHVSSPCFQPYIRATIFPDVALPRPQPMLWLLSKQEEDDMEEMANPSNFSNFSNFSSLRLLAELVQSQAQWLYWSVM